jgi:hypothetical protein
MSQRISAASRPSNAVFFKAFALRLCLSYPPLANLFGDGLQLLDELPEAVILLQLLASAFDCVRGDDVSYSFAGYSVGQRVAGAVAGVVLLGTVASGFAALTKTGYQRARAHIADCGELGFQFIALQDQSLDIERIGHGST